jgi:phage-related protein
MADGTPHRVVDSVLDSAANGAKSMVSGLTGALSGLGEGIQSGLDQPWKAVGGPDQPLRIVDRLLDGALNATINAVNQGGIETLRIGGKSVQTALDHPVENFGIPPSLGTGMNPLGRGMGRFKPPTPPRFWN